MRRLSCDSEPRSAPSKPHSRGSISASTLFLNGTSHGAPGGGRSLCQKIILSRLFGARDSGVALVPRSACLIPQLPTPPSNPSYFNGLHHAGHNRKHCWCCLPWCGVLSCVRVFPAHCWDRVLTAICSDCLVSPRCRPTRTMVAIPMTGRFIVLR